MQPAPKDFAVFHGDIKGIYLYAKPSGLVTGGSKNRWPLKGLGGRAMRPEEVWDQGNWGLAARLRTAGVCVFDEDGFLVEMTCVTPGASWSGYGSGCTCFRNAWYTLIKT